MKLASHYVRLREKLPYAKEHQEQEIMLDEIAAILDCTHRNVTMIMQKMDKQGWLRWTPRKGRGNRSLLQFLTPVEEVVLFLAKELVERKDLRGALEQMNISSIPDSLKENFHSWLNGYFGYSSELRDSKRFDTLRFPLTQPIQSLDPAFTNFSAESHLVNQLFDSLVSYNRLTQTVEPHLAHAWEANKTRTAWTFYVRKGVRFHHGKELAAEDIAFTLERLKLSSARSLYRWVFQQIERIEIMDPLTLTIHLTEPNELFPQFMSTNRAAIIPSNAYREGESAFALAPIGTGPFKLNFHDASMSILDAFPDYFQGRAHLDRVELWHVPDMQEQQKDQLRTLESFQIIHNYRMPDSKENDYMQVQQQGTTCKFVTFNLLKQGPLKDPAIREAVYEAFDQAKLLNLIDGDAIYAADSFIRHTPVHPIETELEHVRAKIKKSGYEGERLVLCTIPHYERDALLVQSLLREAGLNIEVVLLPVEEFKGDRRLQADLLLFSIMLDNDAELRLIDLYKSMQHHLEPACKAAVEQFIRAALREPQRDGRAGLLHSIERRLHDEHVLQLLYFKRLKTAFHSSVKGITLDSLDWVQFKNIWFKPHSDRQGVQDL
ncbi:DNA-binding transcriptional regulator SgrR of sgrS sRNA, contains a MarR-type HTH domain and a solute-binding domain [Paenibacillus sp. 1_12]|uniref:ABC transporter substrate-binding protein n=1 Tax=Paenibacillus sp. 1_12 TaxID=1566278 RepID=UPI0008EDE62E|nr:ABC transporter substrate-binding protein [Paenibacillus sp. 1_12]SFL72501.1 DNA-binding transcriptional regulator SgrR of sgrS sRNA, contains a MarR-type HTH domain and a solute-binding domain [Paenibacillus sp. 1_12]